MTLLSSLSSFNQVLYIYIFFNAQNDSQEGTIRGQSVLFKGDFSRVSMHA
jgi:hypothetical protein